MGKYEKLGFIKAYKKSKILPIPKIKLNKLNSTTTAEIIKNIKNKEPIIKIFSFVLSVKTLIF